MAYILLIETATEVCSVALAQDNQILAIRENREANNHTAFLTLFIQELLTETGLKMSDLDAVAVSKGAGSYTGLRVGFSVAKGICYAVNKPIILISTLQSLAWAMRQKVENPSDYLYFPAIDARRMDAYAALYDTDFQLIKPVECYTLSSDLLANYDKKIIIGGNAAEKYKPLLPNNEQFVFSPIIHNSAAHLVGLAQQAFEKKQFEDVAYCEPFYLKPPFATVAKPIW